MCESLYAVVSALVHFKWLRNDLTSLPCVSMSIRNVPNSLNCTGGISDCKNFNTTSATPADSILDLFTTGERKQHVYSGTLTEPGPEQRLDGAAYQVWPDSARRWELRAEQWRSLPRCVDPTVPEASAQSPCPPYGCSSRLWKTQKVLKSDWC